MGTRGRKSAAELALIGPGGIETRRRLEAPADLSAEQAEVWRGIVNTLPADWFSPGSGPAPAALCRHTVAPPRPPPPPPPERPGVCRATVTPLPADWFSPGSAPVLAALCRHTVAARRAA